MSNGMSLPGASFRARYSIVPYGIYLSAFAAMIGLAYRLTPSPAGVGTHQQLGLPPCGFLTVTGYPCPSCGLTTSFVHLVHGEVLNSLKTQPFGTALFAAMFLAAILSVVSVWKKIPLSDLLQSDGIERAQYILLILFFIGWLYKIWIMKMIA